MVRIPSQAAREAMFAQETEQVFMVLLVIWYPTFAGAIRVCNDMVNHQADVGDGQGMQTFYGAPFDVILPSERDDQPSTAQVKIGYVHPDMIHALRVATTPPVLDIYVVLASQPSTIEAGPLRFELRGIMYTANEITANLGLPPVLNEPYPALTFTPDLFPGVFGPGASPGSDPIFQMQAQQQAVVRAREALGLPARDRLVHPGLVRRNRPPRWDAA